MIELDNFDLERLSHQPGFDFEFDSKALVGAAKSSKRLERARAWEGGPLLCTGCADSGTHQQQAALTAGHTDSGTH